MKVCVLSSGSIGNATIIETAESAILIDNGLSLKKLQELMKKADFDESKIKHILITHEHGDHVKGVGVCARKLKLNICATAKTIDEMIRKNLIKEGVEATTVVEKDTSFILDELEVTPFRISHDAVDPVGYIIRKNEKTLVYMTDTGYVTDEMINKLKNADTYIMEVNHNVEMLQMCDRPWQLKQRILSDCGHLSNEDSAYALSKMIGEKTKHVYMAHLSQDANLPDLAEMTVKYILKEQNVNMNKVGLHMTYAMHPSKVVSV
ncbi:MAG: MBL fold metallo-hydrolase [Turicibacter sp.]